jgi:hypothetical protein
LKREAKVKKISRIKKNSARFDYWINFIMQKYAIVFMQEYAIVFMPEYVILIMQEYVIVL